MSAPSRLRFRAPLPKAPLGSWMLLDANRLLASPHCSSAFANGVVEFIENKSAPPNRAYLKLWEALTLAGPVAAAGRALPGSGRQSGRLELGAAIPGRAGHRHRPGAAGPGDSRPARHRVPRRKRLRP